MPRRARAEKRPVIADPKYQSELVATLINRIMIGGKKRTAEIIVYRALTILSKESSREPLIALEQAVRNVTPFLEVKSRRVGGATYQVPVEVRPERGLALALRWLIKATQARQGRTMAEKLAAELNDALLGQGATAKKREDTHKMAEANRAFAHYRW